MSFNVRRTSVSTLLFFYQNQNYAPEAATLIRPLFAAFTNAL